MKTTLTKILTKITPLPWTDDVPRKERAQVVRANSIYRRHGANALPELVEAARPFVKSTEPISAEQFIRLRNAISAAEEVEI